MDSQESHFSSNQQKPSTKPKSKLHPKLKRILTQPIENLTKEERALRKEFLKKKLEKKKLQDKQSDQNQDESFSESTDSPSSGSVLNSGPPKRNSLKPASTRTISTSRYDQVRRHLRIRTFLRFFFLVILVIVSGMIFYAYGMRAAQKQSIVDSAQKGVDALAQNQQSTAEAAFNRALGLFRSYQPDPTVYEWNANSKLYGLMFQVAAGFRTLKQFPPCLDTYGEIAKRNLYGRKQWVGERLFQELRHTIHADHWNEGELRTAYNSLLRIAPSKWKHSEYHLVWATELIGLHLIPMETRYLNADIIAYGKPLPMLTDNDERIRIQAERFYRAVRLPGSIEFKIPQTLPDHHKERLKWYTQSEYECLVFGTMTTSGPILNGIEGIVVSDQHTVEPFDELVIEHEN